MTPRETILAQINHEETRPVPYTLYSEDAELSRQIAEYYGDENWNSRLTQYMITVGGIDASQRNPINETHAQDIYGTIWRMDRRPWHLEEPALKQPSLEGYEFPTPDKFVNLGLKENAEKVLAANPDKFSMIGLGWGLFEFSWIMRGFQNSMMDSITETDFYEELLDLLTESRLSMVEQCADVPADAIMFGDDWGDQRGVIIGPERWRKFIKSRWAKIYDAVHAQGKIVISHSCGSVADIIPDMIEIGLDVFESVQPEPANMNPYELKKQYGDKITFWGMLGSQSIVHFGTPQQIHDEIKHLIREVGKGGGFIISTAKAFQPGTPLENAIAVIEAFTNQDA